MCTYITKKFIEIPPCAKKVIFSTEFVLLDLNPHFYEVNQEVWKRPCAWRNFKNIFCVLSGYPKKPFRTEKSSIFNFRYVKEVWVSGLLGVKQKLQTLVSYDTGRSRREYPKLWSSKHSFCPCEKKLYLCWKALMQEDNCNIAWPDKEWRPQYIH